LERAPRLLGAEADKVVVDIVGYLFFRSPSGRLYKSIALRKDFLPAAIFIGNSPQAAKELFCLIV
jgi:hypothetical protein